MYTSIYNNVMSKFVSDGSNLNMSGHCQGYIGKVIVSTVKCTACIMLIVKLLA